MFPFDTLFPNSKKCTESAWLDVIFAAGISGGSLPWQEMELIPQVLLVRFFKGENMEVFSTPKVVVVFPTKKTGWTVSSSSAFDIMIQIPPLGFAPAMSPPMVFPAMVFW